MPSAEITASTIPPGERCAYQVAKESDDTLHVKFSGHWVVLDKLPEEGKLVDALSSSGQVQQIKFSADDLKTWDSSLVSFLKKVMALASEQGKTLVPDALPDGVKGLLKLATAVPESADARRNETKVNIFTNVGNKTIALCKSLVEMVEFLGESCLSLLRMFTGRARFRKSDLWLTLQECGANALPIVSLISFLVGLILAFIGSLQLAKFGAQIYVADLVAIAMAREMACMMTAIVMAGRTGAAFAAQLGTMTVNEEIDAFKTLGFSAMDFLVLPRMLALALMMPLLSLYSTLLGILAGVFVAVFMLDISLSQYLHQTQVGLHLTDISIGFIKAAVFGVLVALAGCLRGMQCGRSSAAVGLAATSAVVTSIVLVISTDAAFAVVTNLLGI
ncbi:MAG: MlaE family ABC transporter permease [Planctomycetota bacterium]|jgi:phospholipid/cholesterol/gamma-HCH transport system permease protein